MLNGQGEVAPATTIEDVRKHFGELLVILVPEFRDAAIDGARAFFCEMAQLPWMQRGNDISTRSAGRALGWSATDGSGSSQGVAPDRR